MPLYEKSPSATRGESTPLVFHGSRSTKHRSRVSSTTPMRASAPTFFHRSASIGPQHGYGKKTEAEEAVKRVAGVNVVVEKIEVKYPNHSAKKDDGDIATEIVNALKAAWAVPSDKVTARVEKGRITLEGELEWNFQSQAATAAVKNLAGVTGVTNSIKIKSTTNDTLERMDIESALSRNWSVGDKGIVVKVSGHNATLTGTVDSWFQKDEAERIAWNAPGVWHVANDLRVDYADE